MKTIKMFVLTITVTYLIGAFVFIEYNPAKWDLWGRVASIVLVLPIFFKYALEEIRKGATSYYINEAKKLHQLWSKQNDPEVIRREVQKVVPRRLSSIYDTDLEIPILRPWEDQRHE